MKSKAFLKAARRMAQPPPGMPINLYGMCFPVRHFTNYGNNSYIRFLEKYFTPENGTEYVYWFKDNDLSDSENRERRVLALLFAYEMVKGGLK